MRRPELPWARVGATLTLSALALAVGYLWANRPAPPLPAGTKVDLVVVDKSARLLTLYTHGNAVRSYPVSLGRDPSGPKIREGDHRTPEGRYFIDRHSPHSAFHLALHVSYPSAEDIARSAAAGSAPGGDIMVHGMRRGLGWIGRAHRFVDWTNGCIAVTNTEMDAIYNAVPDHTPILLRP